MIISIDPVRLYPRKQEYTVTIKGLGNVTTVVTSDHEIADEWLTDVDNNKSSEYRDLHGRRIVGVDVLQPPSNSGDVKSIGTLQLCVGCHCLVYKISLSRFIPLSLPRFLSDQTYIFVGTDVAAKLEKLSNDYYIRFRAPPVCVDLGAVVAIWRGRPDLETCQDLRKLAKVVLRLELPAPGRFLGDQWNAAEMTYLQVFDATVGAYVSFAIGWEFGIVMPL